MFDFLTEIAQFLSLHISTLNTFGYMFTMLIIIAGGASMMFAGTSMVDKKLYTGTTVMFAGLAVIAAAMILVCSIDTAYKMGLINFI
jgi:hypothetical protein